MIVAVGSDKGAPGATTLAVLLALVWPGLVAVMTELDPRGAVLPFRLPRVDGQMLRDDPSIASVAIEARSGLPVALERYAQSTLLGAQVIAGEASAAANAKLVRLLPLLASAAESWPGTLVADLGELHAGNPALAVAQRATVTLLVVRSDVEGLARLRDQVDELGGQVGDPARGRVSLGVVTVAPPGESRAAGERVARVLASIGSPAPLVGVFADDPAAARALWQPSFGKRLPRNPVVRSAVALSSRMRQLWPDLDQPTVAVTSLAGGSAPPSAAHLPLTAAEPGPPEASAVARQGSPVAARVLPAPPPPPPPPPTAAPSTGAEPGAAGQPWSGQGPGWEWPPRRRASGGGR